MRELIILSVLMLSAIHGVAQNYFSDNQKQAWLQKAAGNTPKLIHTKIKPENQVDIVDDATAFQHKKATNARVVKDLYSSSFKDKSGIILDLGDHYTGYFTFSVGEYKSDMDAPLRLKFTFGEVPAEVSTSFDNFHGNISRAWLQDETVTIEQLPATITIPRRLSCRYIKIEDVGSSPYADFCFTNMEFDAVTSANKKIAELPESTPAIVRQIDNVAQNTLKECMQTVYEDGPKRDHRLWIGDLYLQMSADNYAFQNRELVKRSLYLMAGLSKDNGYLNHTVFEKPVPHPQRVPFYLYEYALLYNAVLNDYVEQTGDKEPALDLWTVAKRQVQLIPEILDNNQLFSSEKADKKNIWQFVDWNEKLDKQVAEQGMYIFALGKTYKLAKSLGKEKEVAYIPGLISQMKKAALTLYDSKQGYFVSGKEKQVSYASQVWMILAKVVDKKQGKAILRRLLKDDKALKPGGPYLYHYVVQALIDCDLNQEAYDLVTTYWGGMIHKGADTFWEVYVPEDDFVSPYNFAPINSYCHAWSCTPIYFIRKYPEIFQKRH